MICPHCNQEHPDGTRFCPETGRPMPQLLSCPNEQCVNYGRPILPPDTRFCPDCGCPIEGAQETPQSSFDIEYNGIILGKTTLRELRQRGLTIDHEGNTYTVSIDDLDIGIISLTYKDIDEFRKGLKNPSILNVEGVINEKKVVNVFHVYDLHLLPCFSKMGIQEGMEDEEIIEILEENGYMHIEDFSTNDYQNVFVSKEKDSNGNYICLNLIDGEALIVISIVTEWQSYRTGEYFYA